MRPRTVLGVLLVAAGVAAAAGPAGAASDDAERLRLSRELVTIAFAGEVRERVEEQLVLLLTQSLGRSVQEKLNRRLLDVEWRILERIVTRFMGQALPPAQMEEIYSEVYARHFDEDELRELIRFNQTSAGRKTIRLQSQISQDALAAMSRVVDQSPARGTLFAELRQEFPALGPGESP